MLKIKRTKFAALFLAFIMSLSVLAGCAPANEGNNNTTNNGEVSDKGDNLADKQIITYNLGAEPKTLDPGTNEAVDGATVVVNAFEGLTRLDANDNPVAAVAENWEVSEDGKKYTFNLKKDILWTDGKNVTANDFEYAWKRALAPETASGYAYQLYYLKNGEAYNSGEITDANEVGVKATDEYTLEVELEYPATYFLSLTAFPTYMPVRQDVVEANPEAWFRNPETYITNGPFKMKEWRPKDQLTFVKNDDYWNADRIKLEQINYKMIEQSTSALAAFKTGQMDYIESPPQQEIPGLLADNTAQIIPNLGTYYYIINISENAANVNPEAAKVLADKRVRKALSMALDRKAIVENVAKGGQLPATSFVPPAIAENDEGKDFKDKDYYSPTGDIEEAKKLMEEAGYANGEGFPTVTLLYNTSEGHQNIAMAIQDMWRKNLGVNVELQNQEWKVFQTTRSSKNYELARGGWLGDYVDPMTFLDMWVTNSPQNDAGWSNQEYDQYIENAKLESDQVIRMENMHKAEDLLMEDMPIIPIYYYTNVVCIKPYVKDVHKSPLGMVYFDDTYIEKK